MTNANNTTKNGNTSTTKRGKRRGFTLIEILIVVVILGVLAALVIPGVTSALGDANKNAATARASQITTMVTRCKQFNSTAYGKLTLGATVSADDLAALANDANYCSTDDLKVPGPGNETLKWNYDATTGKFSSPLSN